MEANDARSGLVEIQVQDWTEAGAKAAAESEKSRC
jgi:hypothetical protein